MKFPEIEPYIKKMSFGQAEDRKVFSEEIKSVLETEEIVHFVKPNTLESLRDLWLNLFSSQSEFELSLGNLLNQVGTEKQHSLCDYFEHLFDKGVKPPEQSAGVETFLHLCAREIEEEYILKLSKTNILSFFPVNYLHEIKIFYIPNLEVFINIYLETQDSFSDHYKILLQKLLYLIYPTSLSENSEEELLYYIQNIMPLFVERFSHQMEEQQILDHTERIAEWFLVWQRHHTKTEEQIDKKDEYYSTPFSTIIKYVPEFIWWNNGLYYRNGDKNFYFGSPGFFHLAKGGSVRKAPYNHHFTKGMARVFVNLPYDFNQTGKDMYIYCYGKSLNARELLSDMLQRFLRHHEDPEILQEELDKWNPVIQKLSCERFEQMDEDQAVPFMGYIYHCLRDQPDFSVKGRSVETLIRDSDAYNAQIRERTQRREQLRRERQERLAKEEKLRLGIWDAHKKVKPLEKKKIKIIELTDRDKLMQEGTVMNHCVGSYSGRCMAGNCSIWSLREFRNDRWYSRVTIELDRKLNLIQASARFNATPSSEHQEFIDNWIQQNGIKKRRY